MQGITTCLWFDTQAEEAANYYTSIFKDAKITKVSYYGEAGPRTAGTVMTVEFQIEGSHFVALNGGPQFTFNEAVSFQLNCESQAEVDELWSKLSDGGEEGPCGWLKHKYGVSWQVTPTALGELLGDPDAERSQRVMKAMLAMKKIEIDELQRAYEG
jgi:predicted 3-demethylubiquinone-9 3-methyltransferase (glyoxalase superfamily)